MTSNKQPSSPLDASARNRFARSFSDSVRVARCARLSWLSFGGLWRRWILVMDDPASGSQSLLTAASAQLFRDVEALLAEQAARYEMELQEREVRKALVVRGLVVCLTYDCTKQHRIASLTADLARARAGTTAPPHEKATLERIFAAFVSRSTCNVVDVEDENAPTAEAGGSSTVVASDAAVAVASDAAATVASVTLPSPVAAPELSGTRPALVSRLSASGTDFDKFGSLAKLSRTSRGTALLGGGSVLAASAGAFVPVPVAEAAEAGARMEPQPRPSATGLGMRVSQCVW